MNTVSPAYFTSSAMFDLLPQCLGSIRRELMDKWNSRFQAISNEREGDVFQTNNHPARKPFQNLSGSEFLQFFLFKFISKYESHERGPTRSPPRSMVELIDAHSKGLTQCFYVAQTITPIKKV